MSLDAAILDVLQQAFGPDLGRLVHGTYRLAKTAVELDQEVRTLNAQMAEQMARTAAGGDTMHSDRSVT